MKDSIEIDPVPQTSTEINNLKHNLVNTKKTNNSLTTDDIVNFKNFNNTGSSFYKAKKFFFKFC